jgi:hypothetical protein
MAFIKKENLHEIVGMFFITRLAIFTIGFFSALVIIKNSWFGGTNSLIDLFFRWDSNWYLSIVNDGFLYIPDKMSNVNFFPLYPLLVKIFSLGVFEPKVIGFVISNISLLVAIIYLYKLVRTDFKEKVSLRAVFYMLICPVSFFFSIFYTEGLFLGLAIPCFYYARKGKWFAASCLGFFVSLTKIVGILIFIPLLVEYLMQKNQGRFKIKNIKKDFFCLLLVPLGLLLHMLYLQLKFGDFLAFYHMQKNGWNTYLTSPLTTLRGIGYFNEFYQILYLGAIIVALILIAYGIFAKIPLSYSIYSLILMFAYLSKNNIDSIARYIGVLFPIYISLAIIGTKSKIWDIFLTIFSIMLLALYVIIFVNGYWAT